MPITIVVPQLGESVVEGTIGKWLKKVGEPIAKDEPIVEIITDKINIELPAPSAGTLGEITAAEGVVAQVGEKLGVILGAGESLPANGSGAPAKAAPASTPPPHQAGGGGAEAAKGASGAPAPPKSDVPQGDAPLGAVAAGQRTPPSAPATGGGGSAPHTASNASPPSVDGERLSPAVRKLVKENNVDVAQIRGSGMGGRVTREDVLTYLEARKVAASAPGRAAPQPAYAGAPAGAPAHAPGAAPQAAPPRGPVKPIPTPSFAAPGTREETVEPLSNVRKMIAQQMVKSRHTAAHCSVFDEADMTSLVEMRGRMKEKVQREYGIKLTYMPFIVKAVVRALRDYPILNASMTDTEVRYKKYYNIGIAVHRDQGLIVPVLHDADRKTLLQMAREIEDLGARARAEKLTLDDIQGGT